MIIKKIFSKQLPDKLLHIIVKKDLNNDNKRVDISPGDEYIQCAYLRLEKGKTFQPHKHLEKPVPFMDAITQESWVVISGKVKCILYDIDDTVIHEEEIEAGEASFTFYGGHNYEILEEGTIVYEYKTGPYYGQKMDKVFI